MEYTEYETCPEFEFAKWDENGKALPAEKGLPKWSRPKAPPKVGEFVNVRMNRIGPSKVIGYFSQAGYLGLRVKPLMPPDWYVNQNGYNATGHVFGMEIDPDPISEPEVEGPRQDQLAALQMFANVHGRTWKAKLSMAWQSGADEQEPDSHLLRQVRNEFGPTWLFSDDNPIKPKA